MALSAFYKKVAGGDGARVLASATRFLRTWQWNEARGCNPSHPYFGGTGRWTRSVPDLIHSALLLQAMRDAGVAASDPYIRRASIFITRCQVVGDRGVRFDADCRDLGGFSTGPVVDPKGGTFAGRSGRPSGASTCLGLTSLLAAGVAPDDARVRSALRWLEEHYSLDAHPGMTRPREGLYGYYYEFAKAMTALGLDRIRDSRGVLHDWRAELVRKLADQQHADGSWTNPDESREPASSSAWTITSLALLTLRQIRP
jgi:squalene-hopene/tetraprenyl-beta-curcumene cyclase